MRIALAKILLERPDILLLDEPTNYLDLEARNWLEGYLRDFAGGFLVVSHDRYFLDSTVNEVYELYGGSLKRYAGTYTQYERVREAELSSLVKRYEEQRAEIEKIEALIERFRYKATKAAMVQERIKYLERMERIELPEGTKRIRFSFPPAPHTGRLVLTVTSLTRRYGSRAVLQDLDFVLEKGERLVVVGRNGAGKSTLLRVLAGVDADFTGSVEPGSGVIPGYFSQDNAELLKGEESIIGLLESEAPTHLIPKLRDMLGSFLFRGDDIHKSLNVLSGGEKSRLALLRLLLRPLTCSSSTSPPTTSTSLRRTCCWSPFGISAERSSSSRTTGALSRGSRRASSSSRPIPRAVPRACETSRGITRTTMSGSSARPQGKTPQSRKGSLHRRPRRQGGP
jgi:ATP-binding cassette subfamily F protein 3